MRVLVVAEQVAQVPAPVVAEALTAAWRRHRPDEVTAVFASDGGAGLLDAIARPEDTWLVTEAAGPHGHPLEAALLLRADGTAVVEAARVAAPSLASDAVGAPMRASTYGVGELLQAAKDAGARRILVGVGGSVTDGGAGALTGLGFRLRVADGSGLKIGAGELHRVATIQRGWADDWSAVEVTVLAEADLTLAALCDERPDEDPADDRVATGLRQWQQVLVQDLDGGGVVARAGSGAGGGLAFGLAVALGADLRPGAAMVWDMQHADRAVATSDLVAIASPAGTPVHARAIRAAADADVATVTLPSLPLAGLDDSEGPDAIDALAEEVVGAVR